MVQRTTNPNNTYWKHYGGSGVKVCERWLNSFEAFLEDMGERPAGTTLGRLLDSGDYEPGNCEWQTWKQQGAEKCGKHAMNVLHSYHALELVAA
jgi:hypothetical protein